MTLYIIGMGLGKADITTKAVIALKDCEEIYLENYTSILDYDVAKLPLLRDKKFVIADRDIVEKAPEPMLESALNNNVAFLVPGDPFSATTHADLMFRAREMGVDVKVIHGISILTAVGVTGLSLYKFGKVSSIVFPDEKWMPETPYNAIKDNKKTGLHTLLLLDIKVKEQSREDLKKGVKKYQESRFMTVSQGIDYLLEIEKHRKEDVFTKETMVVACARLGTESEKIVYGKIEEVKKVDIGGPLHCLIVPGDLHFMEEELLNHYKLEKDESETKH